MSFHGSYSGDAFAREQLAVSTVAVPLTSSVRAPVTGTAAQAVDCYTDQPLRATYVAGVVPTSTTGFKINVGIFGLVGSQNLENARFIRDATATGDATVEVHYLSSEGS